MPLIDGGLHTEVCPAGCTSDHSSDARGAFLEDLVHLLGGEASMTVGVEDGVEGMVQLPVLRAQIQVEPYSPDARTRVPHVVLEPSAGEVVSGLGPVELAAVIARVRAHCDRLDEVLAQLVAARTELLPSCDASEPGAWLSDSK
ncbi:DUF6907 domain-containing protein [Streptomyces sp. NPDC001404]|uniref:DUF6907 domain-containing protein n=1 Tax=Streptomyces sp. NPDC001404 TaxID=3364571 RepID=UPI003696C5EE